MSRNVTALKLKTFDRLVCDKRLTGLSIRVAWRIIDRMNHDLISWPSYARLAKELNCSERAVKRAVALLCKLGWLDKVEGGGRGRSNRYALKNDTVSYESPFTASGSETVTYMTINSDSDGQKTVAEVSPESFKEPIKESSGHAASPPNGGGAPLKQENCLQGVGVLWPEVRKLIRETGIDKADWLSMMTPKTNSFPQNLLLCATSILARDSFTSELGNAVVAAYQRLGEDITDVKCIGPT
jgi:hypothetical protein